MVGCFLLELPTMNDTQTFSDFSTTTPRHPQQEIADLLATALLRLRQTTSPESDTCAGTGAVGLGFCGHQSVNGNTPQISGVDL
jgi:hypothetical protein